MIDASLLVGALTDAGTVGRWAEAVIADGPLVAPALLLEETANILRRLEAGQIIDASLAGAAMGHLQQLDVELHDSRPLLERIWALRRNLTAYDAAYVALAEALELPLATLDHRLARAEGPICKFLTPAWI